MVNKKTGRSGTITGSSGRLVPHTRAKPTHLFVFGPAFGGPNSNGIKIWIDKPTDIDLGGINRTGGYVEDIILLEWYTRQEGPAVIYPGRDHLAWLTAWWFMGRKQAS